MPKLRVDGLKNNPDGLWITCESGQQGHGDDGRDHGHDRAHVHVHDHGDVRDRGGEHAHVSHEHVCASVSLHVHANRSNRICRVHADLH